MEVLLDWTPRKRSHSVGQNNVTPEETSRDDREEVAATAEQPFAFVPAKKKRNRCRLACCTTFIVPVSLDPDPTQEVLHIPSSPAVFLLPPASSGAAWFSGIAALNPEDSTAAQQQYGGKSSKGKNGSTKSDENGLGYAGGRYGDTSEDDDDDDDPFMERVGGDQNSSNCSSAPSNINSKQELNNASPTTALSDNAKLGPSTHFGWVPIAMQAHEAEIDDCLRCAVGGYQHFRLAFTDAQRGLAGATMVERTGGEFLKLNSDCLQFSTTKSIGGAAALPLIERFFPAVVRQARTSNPTCTSSPRQDEENGRHGREELSPDALLLLKECVICFGTLAVDALPLRPKH